MLITGHPQFETQNDAGLGHGIPPIPEWQLGSTARHDHLPGLNNVDVDDEVWNVFVRLRNVFQRAQTIPFSSSQLHDLTCFVIHRLLISTPDPTNQPSPLTEYVRYATILYMFIIQGPTYFSHAVIFNQILDRFMERFEHLQPAHAGDDSLEVWFLAVGMVASVHTPHYRRLSEKAAATVARKQLGTWADVLVLIKTVLWLATEQAEAVFRPHWDAVLHGRQSEPPDLPICMPSSIGAGFI